MTGDYSKTPLVKKLGIKDGMRVKIINPPANYYDLLGEPFPEFEIAESDLDFVHHFTNSEAEFFNVFDTVKDKIKPTGMFWVSWYKKASGNRSELSGEAVRNFARKNNWIDAKVCSVDASWTAVKLVVPVKQRN